MTFPTVDFHRRCPVRRSSPRRVRHAQNPVRHPPSTAYVLQSCMDDAGADGGYVGPDLGMLVR